MGKEMVRVKEGNSTPFALIITVLCTVVGGAILALPASMHFTSLFIGIGLILFVSGLSVLSAYKLAVLADSLGEESYVRIFTRVIKFWRKKSRFCRFEGISSELELFEEKSWEDKLIRIFIQVIIFWYTFGVGVSFIVIIADSMQPLAKSWMGISGFCSSRQFWILVVFPVLFGVSSVEQITELKAFSLVSFLTMVYTSIIISVRYLQASLVARSPVAAEEVRLFSLSRDVFQGFPILSIAFTMHYNIPQLYHELRSPSKGVIRKCLGISIVLIVALYLLVAVTGYLHFGGHSTAVGGDILALYGKDDLLINIGRLLMFLHFALGFPMVSVACRRAFTLFFIGKEANVQLKYRVISSFIIVGTACVLAAFSRGITEIFVFNGTLFGIHIVMTFPAMLYFIAFRTRMNRFDMLLTCLLGFCGLFFSFVGFLVVLLEKLH